MKIRKVVEDSRSAIILLILIPLTAAFTSRGINYYGLIILVIGGLIYFYNRHIMGKSWTVEVRPKNKLIKTGFFKYIRHPLYLGCILSGYGVSLTLNSIIAFVVNTIITVPFLYYRAKIEEEFLVKKFKDYKNYMKSTGMFLPKLK